MKLLKNDEHMEQVEEILETRITPRLMKLHEKYGQLFFKYMNRANYKNRLEMEEFYTVINDLIYEETYIAYCKGFEDGKNTL